MTMTSCTSKKGYGREESHPQWVEESGLAFRKLTHKRMVLKKDGVGLRPVCKFSVSTCGGSVCKFSVSSCGGWTRRKGYPTVGRDTTVMKTEQWDYIDRDTLSVFCRWLTSVHKSLDSRD